jgi:hypothetical protein
MDTVARSRRAVREEMLCRCTQFAVCSLLLWKCPGLDYELTIRPFALQRDNPSHALSLSFCLMTRDGKLSAPVNFFASLMDAIALIVFARSPPTA